jgi:glutathione S-transferase
VQRAAVLLHEKGVAHESTVVDLQQKPDWFLAISPYGRVPVLVADGTPIFESSAICEFLEETHSDPPLLPRDPITRARDRGWFASAADDLYAPLFKLIFDPAAAEAAGRTLDERMARLERELAGRAWLSWNGERFGFGDVAAASFLVRAASLSRLGRWSIPAALTATRAWSDRVCARDSVVRSLPANLDERIARLMARP